MPTNPRSRCHLRLLLGAVAVLLPLTAVALGLRIPTGGDPSVIDTVTMEGTTRSNPAGKAVVTPEMRQAGADESWWQTVSAELEREEYAARSTEQGLEAPNRAHNLRTTFGEQGIEIRPRTAKNVSPAWSFAWETTGFGRSEHMEEVGPVSPSSAGARVVYQRDGWSEWYENTAKGLEQGFTIERRPVGEGPIEIVGAFPAELHPRAREDGAIDFLDELEACVIRYGELHVWDAKGTDVPAELVVAGNMLAIHIDDKGAEYPLIVDPLMTSPAWTAEGNQIASGFGTSLGTAGDVNGDGFSDVIVGAPYYDNQQEDEGRAYVYLGSAAGLATTPVWTAEGNQVFGNFAWSVGTAGDVNGDGFSDVIVGALFIQSAANIQGAFVYHGSASGLGASPAWIAENAQTDASFGVSVGTAGDVNGDGYDDVIIGASDYDNGQSNEGRAFVYYGSAGGLAASPAWTGESNQASASYGNSVSTAGDVNADGYDDIIVGAWQYDNNNQPNQGRAFVYLGSASGLGMTAAWFAESGLQGCEYGKSVATAGDLNGDGYGDVLVGAPRFNNPEGWEGRVYAYLGSTSGLAASPGWTAESNQIGAEMGNAVATAGDVNGDGYSDVIVGAHQYDNGQNNEGRSLMYLGSATGLGTTAAWTNEVGQGAYGGAVACAGDVNGDGYSDVIVGAHFFGNGQAAEGAAFVYHGFAASLATTAAWNQELPLSTGFGTSVANAGDVNGDGYSDVIVGAPNHTNGQAGEGVAYVYHGSAAGLSTTPAWTAESNETGARFGSVASAGDVNGDGYSDVIIGAPFLTNGEQDEGRAYVYHGSAAGLTPTAAWTTESHATNARFGASVASAGDVNGDGYSDVIVGAPLLTNGQQNEGRADVYHGSATGLASTPAWNAEANQDHLTFGTSVSSAGDVNGDGYSDVIIAAPGTGGRASVFHGSANGLSAAASWSINRNVRLVATAGDVNGDGFSDAVMATSNEFFACMGSASGLGSTPAWTVGMNPPFTEGFSLATAGDVNADGYSDVIIGLVEEDDNSPPIVTGLAVVYHGSATGLSNWSWSAQHTDSGFGIAVATAGDVNGDGYSDIIVGDSWFENIQSKASCYLGNAGDGVDRIARQSRTDDSAPIWLLGNSDSDSAFRLKALGRTPAGRGKVRFQYEIKPAGVPFDGAGLVTGVAADTGAPGVGGSFVQLTALAGGLTPETLYHWRLRTLTDSPFSPRSPWMWLPYNGSTEADIRTKAATTAVGGEEPHPTASLWLAPGAPNPFNPRTTLSFLLPVRTPVRLAIHDVQGRLVRVLVDEVLPAGRHAVEWDGRDARGQELATGVYLSRLEAGGEVRSQKLALVK